MKDLDGKLDTDLFRANPTLFLEKAIKEYVRTSPLNQLITFNNDPIFEEPIVAFANGDDPKFQNLKTIVGEFHLKPQEAMEKYIQARGWRYGVKSPMGNISVVSWALPIPFKTRLSERKTTYGGSTRYNHTRWRGAGIFSENLTSYVSSLVEIMGYNAVAPTRTKFFETKEMSGGWRSANWSERHIAYACGLGTFGLNGLMITRRGCAVYLGSMVCDLTLTPTSNVYTSHIANCLFYKNKSCRQCIERCPAGAISEAGRSNIKCRENLTKNQSANLRSLGLDRELIGLAPACGLCSTKVPCEDRIPLEASDDRP
jgi:hypothetical protein